MFLSVFFHIIFHYLFHSIEATWRNLESQKLNYQGQEMIKKRNAYVLEAASANSSLVNLFIVFDLIN